VILVAGEDLRYRLSGPGIDDWLPRFLENLDGTRSLPEVLEDVEEKNRQDARDVVERLYGERVLVDGPTGKTLATYRLSVQGTGLLADALQISRASSSPAAPDHDHILEVLAQDRLDYDEVLDFNRRQRNGHDPWLWATVGPLARAFVSPVFWSDSGPCLECLVRHFQRLSPFPELYDSLIAHSQNNRPISPARFPAAGTEILKHLVLWKTDLLADPSPPAALYRLHVLEANTLEISSHRVFLDPECPGCGQS
jgi:bacteriocin biosynthesis cyclodehydratase domain-containing protein